MNLENIIHVQFLAVYPGKLYLEVNCKLFNSLSQLE